MISPLRLLNSLLRLCLGLLAAGLVLAALYVSLGRELAPLFADYRETLEQRASEALRTPLRIGRLSARMNGFLPELVARDISLGEEAGLRIDQLRLRPDLLGSLLHWQPRLQGLELGGVQLLLRQDQDGRWSLAGVPQGQVQSEAQSGVDPAHWLRQLRRFKHVSVVDSQLIVQPRQGVPLNLSYLNLNLDLSEGGDLHRLDGRLLLPDGKPLALHLDLRLRPSRWQEASADLYLRLPQSDWARWLPEGLLGDWHLQRLVGGGEVWARWSERTLQRAVMRLHLPLAQVSYADQAPVRLEELSLSTYFEPGPNGRRLLVDSLAVTLDGTRWGEARLRLEEQRDTDRWDLASDRLSLAPLVPLVQQLAPLPEPAREWLQALRPEGQLRNIQLSYQPDAEPAERLRYTLNLEGVGFAAHRGVPAAAGVRGRLDGNLAGGELQIDSRDLMLHLPQLFPAPWRYRRAQGRLGWRLGEEGFSLWAPYLSLDGEEGRLAGDFMLRFAHDPAAEDYMDLRVSLREGDARFAGKYLPTASAALSPALADWLQRAIRGGELEQGFFQYQGALNAGVPPEARSLALYFKVRDAELDYQPGWPMLREGRGELFVEDSGVRVALSDGRLLNSRIREASFAVPHAEPGQPSRLLVNARLLSSVTDALQILRNRTMPTAEAFAGWEGEGDVEAALRLDIPLDAGHAPQADVQFTPKGARLRLPYLPGLELDSLYGEFRYQTRSGLSARGLRARFLEQGLQGRIDSDTVGGRQRTLVDVQGRMPVDRLAQWLGQGRPLPASGLLPYRLRLRLDGNDSLLRVDSSLQGVALDLPAPFGKRAAEARYADWRMSLGGPQQRYWLDYNDFLSLALSMPGQDWQQLRGEVRLGLGLAPPPSAEGVRLRGRLDSVDVPAWRTFWQRYGSSAGEPGGTPLLREGQLHIGRLTGVGIDPQDLLVRVRRVSQAWALDLDSRVIAGDILVPDDAARPLRVQLEQLRLPAPTADSKRGDALAGIDPRTLPAVDLRIDQVLLGDEPLGAWSFLARPSGSGWALRELALDLKGLKINGEAGWSRLNGADASWFRGRLHGGDLSKILKAWGFAPTASSERFSLQVDGNWPGAPSALRLANFSGTLDADLRNGQFSELQGSASALRVFGLLNFDAIGRRLRLDFSDLFGRGLSYDRVRGKLLARNGLYTNLAPTTLTGPSANLEMTGSLNMVSEQVDVRMLVTLPLTNNLPLAALIAGAPVLGGALFLVDRLLGNQMSRFAAVEYSISGPLNAPRIVPGKPRD
ncbi:hypothetical protein SF06_17020 [Pseudomonas flexibilis]|uniref:TIGR02099 family protein n=1 Tax=Pseudomonas flexibilis TaxID=706570 RepID=A0A1N6SVA8_9PSED|nr:YhdP family protein [Pseudomonas flexibilis]KHL69629.1 hypothetical protein SF06_17020 [Pseudomonas flexibilis]SIQ44932.1 TIGR02099 family protein [Pseudomonas flexibilis]